VELGRDARGKWHDRELKAPGCGPEGPKSRKAPEIQGLRVEGPGIEFRSLGARWAFREDIPGHQLALAIAHESPSKAHLAHKVSQTAGAVRVSREGEIVLELRQRMRRV
jgi:hypothetical protein